MIWIAGLAYLILLFFILIFYAFIQKKNEHIDKMTSDYCNRKDHP